MRNTIQTSLLAVACLTGSTLAAAPPQQAPAVSLPGYPAVGASPAVTLASPGAEPRIRLRYKPAAGFKETLTMSTTMSLNMVMEGMAMPQMDMPVMKMTADVGVTGVAANGDITYDVAFTGMTAEAQPGMDPTMVAMAQGTADNIKALKGSVTLTDRGINKSSTINVDQIADPTLKQLLSSMSSSLESMSIPFPDEAIGVGGKWEVRQAIKNAGAQMFQRIECEVVSVDAQSVTIKTKTEQTIPQQSVANPALPGGSLTVEKGAGASTGTTTTRFMNLVPTAETSGSTAMAVSMDLAGQVQKMSVETKLKVSIAPQKK
jgi:hypothetical protein